MPARRPHLLLLNTSLDGAAGNIAVLLDRTRIHDRGRAAGSAPHVHEFMQKQPVVTSARLVTAIGLSKPTAKAALAQLMQLGIVEEIAGQPRHRIYSYKNRLRILSEGAEPV